MIYLDSCFLVSFYCTDEENHARSLELIKDLTGNITCFSDHVLDEVVTLINARFGSRRAFEVGSTLFELQNNSILLAVPEELRDSLKLVKKFEGLSFCDALNIVLMKNRKIKKIVSFDKDFDLIKGIERVY